MSGEHDWLGSTFDATYPAFRDGVAAHLAEFGTLPDVRVLDAAGLEFDERVSGPEPLGTAEQARMAGESQ